MISEFGKYMYKKFLFFFIQLLLAQGFIYGQNYQKSIDSLEHLIEGLESRKIELETELEDKKLFWVSQQIKKYALPAPIKGEQVVHHSAMSLSYNEEHEQANWVAHMVTKDIEEGKVRRTNDFRVDPLVRTATAVKADYWYSGYDRGHLAPSADFRWSKKALSESYFYSNMSPQLPELNREIWAKLENQIREWVIEDDALFVITGGVLKPALKTIGENEVSVPNFYYKVIMDLQGDDKKALAFVIENGASNKHFLEYAVSVDSVEMLTGIDFFHTLDDELEIALESKNQLKKWTNDAVSSDGVNPLPFKKGRFNTLQAKYHIGEECKVCGTVVATKYNEKGKGAPTYINIDKKFPNHVFTVTVWGDDRKNFSFEPELELMNKVICVSGVVKSFKNIPQITLHSESQLEFLDEYSSGTN